MLRYGLNQKIKSVIKVKYYFVWKDIKLLFSQKHTVGFIGTKEKTVEKSFKRYFHLIKRNLYVCNVLKFFYYVEASKML